MNDRIVKELIGKTIKYIGFLHEEDTLGACVAVRFEFTDGTAAQVACNDELEALGDLDLTIQDVIGE